MPYAIEYTSTYKSLIKSYWESQIDLTSFVNKVDMKVELNVFLDDITTAETNYKTRHNDLSQGYLRLRWQQQFGFFSLYVLYQHCMQFPVSANLPAIQGMIIPIISGGSLITDDDLRGFSTGWRYTFPGNGTTSTPWFTLTDIGAGSGQVDEIDNGLGLGEATALKNAFNGNYPLYSSRFSNSTSYAIGGDVGGGAYVSITDFSPACSDQDRFWNNTNPTYGTIDRMREFLNYYGYSTHNLKRFRDGRTIMNYLTAGGAITIINKPKEWMLAHGGTELMAYMGWTDIAGNIL